MFSFPLQLFLSSLSSYPFNSPLSSPAVAPPLPPPTAPLLSGCEIKVKAFFRVLTTAFLYAFFFHPHLLTIECIFSEAPVVVSLIGQGCVGGESLQWVTFVVFQSSLFLIALSCGTVGSGTSLVTAAAGPVLILVNLFPFLFSVWFIFLLMPSSNLFQSFYWLCLFFFSNPLNPSLSLFNSFLPLSSNWQNPLFYFTHS